MPEINLKCSCGKVRGKTKNVNESSGTRIMCCCDDCQSFAQYLEQESSVLDQYGGTDIFQMPISYIKITEGMKQISSVRLSAKGMYRWYTKCCNTPIGNSMNKPVLIIVLSKDFIVIGSARFARKSMPAEAIVS